MTEIDRNNLLVFEHCIDFAQVPINMHINIVRTVVNIFGNCYLSCTINICKYYLERIKARISLPCTHSKTRDEIIMNNYIKTFLLLPCLVSGLVEERAGNDMEISERRQCYVFGQCQVNFIHND